MTDDDISPNEAKRKIQTLKTLILCSADEHLKGPAQAFYLQGLAFLDLAAQSFQLASLSEDK